MGLEFDWQVDDDESGQDVRPNRSTPPWLRWGLSAFLGIIILSLVGSLWWRVNSAETALRDSVQQILDLQEQAYLAQDGDLFFSVLDSADDAFYFSQLRPDQQRFYSTKQLVTKAEKHNNIIWANISTTLDGETLQRVAFFEQLADRTHRVATDRAYWGEEVDTVRSWGTLKTFEADAQWITQLDEIIAATVNSAPLAQSETVEDRIFIIVIRDDYAVSPLPQIIYYPSPRLVGLTADGQPTEDYWNGLSSTIAAQTAPITIRFALPELTPRHGVTIFLQKAATDFAAQFAPGRVTVELLTEESLDADPTAWLPTVDGALLETTEALIKQGAVYDLTEIVALDREFDRGDFYPQAWRSAWWNERMWFVPWSTSLNLLYINKDMFRANDAPLPTVDSSWEDLESALKQIKVDADERVFIDPSLDMLYAVAFDHNKRCQQPDCISSITPMDALAALEWYREMVQSSQILTDLSPLDEEERERTVMGTLSAHKQVAAWTGSPINYEYQLGLQMIDLLPLLDVSAETHLKMPLHPRGALMSNYTDQPYLTWQWLKFLSYQAPPPRLRNIPARPSVARQSNFWEWLPTPIADAYKQALPNARPILIGEENYFTWEQLTRATQANELTSTIAQPAPTKWFMQP